MENKEIIGAVKYLSYDEIEDFKTEGSKFRNEMIKQVKIEALTNLANTIPNDTGIIKAFSLEIELLDGMNLIAKITEIPIVETLVIPEKSNCKSTNKFTSWIKKVRKFLGRK